MAAGGFSPRRLFLPKRTRGKKTERQAGKMNGINVKTLYRATYIYLALPLFIFFASWFNYAAAGVFSLLLALAFYKTYTATKDNMPEWRLKRRFMLFLFSVAALWCFLAGIGYFYYQSFDYHFRNAVFRDLINYPWPVFYERADTPLVYYMAFWLVPATLGKLFAPLLQNAYWNFYLANIFLYVYAVVGVALIFAQLAAAVRTENFKKLTAAVLIFVFFSGLDVIGMAFFRVQEQPFAYHFEWWATFIQYSSFTTGMFWVFNQFIPIALITLLLYNERNIRHFGFLIALALFFSPYPTASIGIFAVAYAVLAFIRANDKARFLSEEIFSVPNIISVFWLLPPIILYFITNSEGMDKLWYVFDYTTPGRLAVFMLLEFLLPVAILLPRYRKHLFFATAAILLCLIPFFRVDEQNNFCMRSSIPPLIMLAVYVIRFLFENSAAKTRLFSRIALILLLLIGAATPLAEFYRGLHYVIKAGRLDLVADDIYTLNQAYVEMPMFGWDANHQFTAREYRSDIFWQYLAKKPQ